MVRALALLLGGCGGAPVQWTSAEPVVTPLVESWRAERPLIEVQIDGRPPVLMRVDPATADVEIAREFAVRLKLPVAAERGVRRLSGRSLRIGGVDAEVEIALVEDAPTPFHDRAVVGVLGRSAFAGRVLTIDPGRRRLVIADTPIEGDWLDDWAMTVGFGPQRVKMRLGFQDDLGRVNSIAAAQAGLVAQRGPRGPVAWVGAARLGSLPARTLAFAATPGASVTGFTLFQDLAIHIDATGPPKVAVAPTTYAPIPACGLQGRDCVRGEVTRVEPERIELDFERPRTVPPEGVWLRVAYGPQGCLSVLVRLRPRPHKPLRAWVKVPPLPPSHAVEVGAPIRLVDWVKLDAPCPGEVCLRDPRVHPVFDSPR